MIKTIAHPPAHILEEFKSELWKDKRIDRNEGQYFTKVFDNPADTLSEFNALKTINNELGTGYVPCEFFIDHDKLSMSCLKGIRVFNLFVELDKLKSDEAKHVKSIFMDTCVGRQKNIQRTLYKNRAKISSSIYPAAKKIKTVIRILSGLLSIRVNWQKLDDELDKIGRYWPVVCNTPFRDSATKNMVICAPELMMQNFGSEEDRAKKIRSDVTGGHPTWLSAPIIDFDFASASDLTTPEDDPITLLLHERTWQGDVFEPGDLVWIEEEECDPYRASVTLMVRYFRLGGRKLSYRLLHSQAHRKRFRYDMGEIYFRRMPSIVKHWSKQAAVDFEEILQFSANVGLVDISNCYPDDFFLSQYPECLRTYYEDMYPH